MRLCLPFDLDIEGSLLSGATVKTLESASFNRNTQTLTLNFTEGSLTKLYAGKPYIVKWDKPNDYVAYDNTNASTCSDVVNPEFKTVFINNYPSFVDTKYIDFIGSFSPVSLTANDKSVLYLGADNTLYYPSAAMTVGSCRAIFQLKGLTVDDLPGAARQFVLNFGDSTEETGIRDLTDLTHNLSTAWKEKGCAWYTLDGRRLSGKPTKNGIYINNGVKIVIK